MHISLLLQLALASVIDPVEFRAQFGQWTKYYSAYSTSVHSYYYNFSPGIWQYVCGLLPSGSFSFIITYNATSSAYSLFS